MVAFAPLKLQPNGAIQIYYYYYYYYYYEQWYCGVFLSFSYCFMKIGVKLYLTTELALTLVCSLILSRLTTATLCYIVPQTAAFRSYSAFRTLRHASFYWHHDSHHLDHSWNGYTGCQFANTLTTSWPSWHTRSGIHQLLRTSAITSDLENLHATSVLHLHLCYTNRLPELAFQCSVPAVWNSLNTDTLCCSSLALFKCSLV